jgi:hypothetical protein
MKLDRDATIGELLIALKVLEERYGRGFIHIDLYSDGSGWLQDCCGNNSGDTDLWSISPDEIRILKDPPTTKDPELWP